MKAIIQRVSKASVVVDDKTIGEIDKGILVLLGISKSDTTLNIDKTIRKIINLRIFDDENGKMNLSVNDIQGGILVISNFTLYGDTKKGNRPSYVEAQTPHEAELLYDQFVEKLNSEYSYKVESGKFQAHMKLSLINDGPVTLIIEN
jgi:D-tyrosyl-tRNA(Tyr) deacylase